MRVFNLFLDWFWEAFWLVLGLSFEGFGGQKFAAMSTNNAAKIDTKEVESRHTELGARRGKGSEVRKIL